MKNYLLVFVFIFNFISAFAQPTIPYATQQPKWVFPVYAEDATGKRDTIYLGYDPGAIDVCGSEPNFGEIWFPGVTDFSLSTFFWLDPVDSIIKTNIRDVTPENTLNYHCGYGIILSNVVMPVTFYWDVSLMRSDSLPFPDQDPLPRAQLNIYFNLEQVVDEPGTFCNISYPIVVSDTINTLFCSCYVKDSLRLIDYFGNTGPQTIALTFEFIPWIGRWPNLSVTEQENLNVSLFPNPVSDLLYVTGDLVNEDYEVTVYDYTLKFLNHLEFNTSNNSSIDISYLKSGIYFFRFTNKSGLNKIVKIIKL